MDRRRLPPVPTMREVVPGAGVNIVLKADQPTGHTVQGVIAHVLTRGDHPRGIKVRLTDGRVGRVQTMSSSANAVGSAASSPALHRDGGGGGGHIRYSDHQQAPQQTQIGLDAYVKERKPKKRGRGKGSSSNTGTDLASSSRAPPESATCPVCGEFEGDEVAVAHHVSSHFE